MANNLFADIPAACIALPAADGVDFVTAGFDTTNTRVIYEVGSPMKSWKPERSINSVVAFTGGKGYYIVPKANMDKTAYMAPPLPSGGGGGGTTPNAPTAGVVDDTLDTYDWTYGASTSTLSDHEFTTNGGTSAITATAKPMSVGNTAKAIGQVGIRVKAIGGNPASAWLFNTTAFTSTGGTTDTDAAAFITFVEAQGDPLGTTDENALHQLFTDLKAAGIAMSDILAIYPAVGSTLASKSYNALYPNTDPNHIVTRHMLWTGTGSPAVDAAGLNPNGTDHKGATGISPAAHFPAGDNNYYFGAYSLEGGAGLGSGPDGWMMGSKDSGTSWIALNPRHASDIFYGITSSASGGGLLQFPDTSGLGWYAAGSFPTPTPVSFIQRRTTIVATGVPSGTLPSGEASLGASSNSGEFSSRKFGPSIFAKNITQTKAAAIGTAFQAYMTARGVAV